MLRPAARKFVVLGATANGVTLTALVGSIVVGAATAFAGTLRPLLLLVPIWLLVRMGLNAIDGLMAREFDQQTLLGAFLNEVGDIASDVALFLPLGIAFPELTAPIVVFTVGAIATEFCGVLVLAFGGSRRYDGPMGKSDRAFVFGVVALVLVALGDSPPVLAWVLWFAVALELATCVNRVRAGLSELSRAEQGAQK